MKRAIDAFFRLLEFLVVVCMAAMVVMVFGNVVLRYGFNSGITVSDEMSRYCFIWLTYIGAMVAMRDGAHLGVDTLIRRLPRLGRKLCFAVNQLLMLFCNVLFFMGTFEMHELQRTNISPVVGISMIWVYGIGYIVAVVMGLMNLHRLWLLFTNRLSDEQLVQVMESEDNAPEEAGTVATPGSAR
ncbi:TRAP transporter small permease [Xenophilus sp. Marseille-Q4582]|uniref:TRAP transporter small permease n=1 Tax=Xenophilus sp. Marseille-Q4582 TaxID=2866600 RepID=UPI001CE3F32B|nr:TRAP transporter small permease [Xenophilus sp. Marseille-Q4582]